MLRDIAKTMRGTFYRSDTRHPTLDQIFTEGFSKRNAAYADPVPQFPFGNTNVSPDIIPESAVCFTRDFKAAPLFPVGDPNVDSWVYILDLDVSTVYNSHKV